MVLKALKLSKNYPLGRSANIKILHSISLNADKGEFVAIMGPSGSGKSTFLHLLGGLDNPTSGNIFLNGAEMSDMSDTKLTLLRRRDIGFIFQFFNLLSTLTVEENVALPLMLDGQKPKHYRETLDRFLALVGLTDRRRHKPDQLSGGEQQRVAIARALIIQPSIVLADEPTGNLDSKTGHAILGLLKQCSTDLKQTIIMVTHDTTAASYANKVVFLADGKVVKELLVSDQADPNQIIQALQGLQV